MSEQQLIVIELLQQKPSITFYEIVSRFEPLTSKAVGQAKKIVNRLNNNQVLEFRDFWNINRGKNFPMQLSLFNMEDYQ